VGFGKAVELVRPEHIQTIRSMQKNLLENLTHRVDGVLINGPKDLKKRLPGNVNVSFDLIEGESVVLHLDMRGIAVITGSACFSRSLEPSYVMMGMGFSHQRAHGSIRFSLSRFNTMEGIEYVVSNCKEVVEALRKISPLKNKE
jgi:cysteine desulfurase